MSRTRESHAPIAVAFRAVLAMLAVLTFLAVRPALDPAPQAAARFGLGILLFALLVDLGRSIAGTGPPVRGPLTPHRQQADLQVDEAYERLRAALQAYLERGRTEPGLLEGLEQAARAQGLAGEERGALERRLREAADPRAPAGSLLAVRLVSGLVVALGVGLATAVVAESLGMPLFAPVLLTVGTSVTTLQWRARDAGARGTGLALGLLGIGLFGLGALRIFSLSPGAGTVLGLAALVGLLATVAATWRAPDEPAQIEDLDETMTQLRRAFLVALVVGTVVVLLEGALTAFLALVGLPGDLIVELAMIVLATVMAFLAVETAGTWMARRRETHVGRRQRRRRREALGEVLDELDRSAPSLEEIA